MRFCVLGAGAIGGYLAAKLSWARQDVVLVARGRQLEAIQANGLRVAERGEDIVVHPPCSDKLAVLEDCDVTFLAVKAHALPGVAAELGRRLPANAALVTLQNGIPWWYFLRYQGPLAGTTLESVDPRGAIARSIDPRQVVGSVVYPATRVVAPGVIEHVEGTRFSIGELDGSPTARCRGISDALRRAGLKCPIRTDIRREIWLKLLGNVALNPISALTRASLATIASDEELGGAALEAMREAATIGKALGIDFDVTVEERFDGAASVGEHKTSMLQDVEAGRPLEVGPIIGAVVEVGRLLSIPMPRLELLYACSRVLDQELRGAT